MEPPVREQQRIYRCHCLLQHEKNDVFCRNDTFSPDQPFCTSCEGRHATDALVLAGIVRVSTYHQHEYAERYE